MRPTLFSSFFALASLAIASMSHAHEFWIEPLAYQVPAGGAVTADIKVGEDFKGSGQSYLKRRTSQFDVRINGQVLPITSRIGDRPAFDQAIPGEGLAVIVHETSNMDLIYPNLAKFQKFVDHKDFTGAIDAHKSRGLPEEGFKETYRRYAKSLVAVGSGAGADARVGLRTEFVALANPYTDRLTALPVQVFYEGTPRANTQVEVFEKSSQGRVGIFTLKTDANGRANIPVKPGHSYMLDAVKLIPGETPGAAWHTLWANLTFEIPA